MDEPSIAFVSREVYPFDSAGLGNYVSFTAAALAPVAEVAIITTSAHEPRYRELVAAGDSRLPQGVRFNFVPEPEPAEVAGWYGHAHLWSARAFETLCRLYPDGGPAVAEFPDYLAEGFVAAQAARTLDRRLRNTCVCIRLYTTAEICSVLDGALSGDRTMRLLCALERYALRNADRILWPGGDVFATYQRFYGRDALAEPVLVRHPVEASAPTAPPPPDSEPLHFLYTGRLERRKGVQNLIRAMLAIPGHDWRLTLVGGDTGTAPLALSMRAQLRLMVGGDPRVKLLERVSRTEIQELIAGAHLLVSPSLWECWPNTILEAFERNRPVLATPVGGQLEMVEPEVTGWQALGVEPEDLIEAIQDLLGDRQRISAIGAAEGPRRAFERLTDPEPVRERYLELAREKTGRGAIKAKADRPLVSVVVPYFRMHAYIDAALDSIEAQTHRPLEVIVVNDGSFEHEDAILAAVAERPLVRVATQMNSGLGQARNLGISLSRGRYVLPLDPDDLLLPEFVERCVETLERSPEIAYVTAWSTYIDEDGTPAEPDAGYRPIGNEADCLEIENVAGSAMAVVRRRVFERGQRFSPDMTSYEDWLFYRQLRGAGYIGHVLPERLLLYRVRPSSMLRTVGEPRLGWLRAEIDAHIREREIEWTPSSV